MTLIWQYEARSSLGRLRSTDPTKAKIVMAIARNLTSDPYPDDSSQLGTSAFWLLRRGDLRITYKVDLAQDSVEIYLVGQLPPPRRRR